MAAEINLSWHGGGLHLPTVGNGQFQPRGVETFSAVLRDGSNVAQVSNDSIGAAEKLPIPEGAEIGRLTVISGTLYALSGMAADANIAVGGGMAYLQGFSAPIPIGYNADGTRHDTLLVVGV